MGVAGYREESCFSYYGKGIIMISASHAQNSGNAQNRGNLTGVNILSSSPDNYFVNWSYVCSISITVGKTYHIRAILSHLRLFSILLIHIYFLFDLLLLAVFKPGTQTLSSRLTAISPFYLYFAVLVSCLAIHSISPLSSLSRFR